MAQITTDFHLASQWLQSGDLVAIPTETVYGLAANALDPTAVQKIFTAKNRPVTNPLILHFSGWEAVNPYVKNIPEVAHQLAKKFVPGALTFLLPKTDRVPDIVTAGSDRVAVRIPDHPLTQELLRAVDFPLAAPSANPYGYISPTTVDHVQSQLGDKIPCILDGGDCVCGLESTIIGFEGDTIVLHRHGSVTVEDLQSVVGSASIRMQTQATDKPLTSGMVLHHYSPRKPVVLFQRDDLDLTKMNAKKTGVVVLQSCLDGIDFDLQIRLSSTGNLSEAAHNLYQAMHQLDQRTDIDLILIEQLPDSGLGKTMNDRLRRAAAPKA